MAPRLFEVQYERQAALNAARAASYTVGRHETETAHVWRGASKLTSYPGVQDTRRSSRFHARV
jgi:hypothetical protein